MRSRRSALALVAALGLAAGLAACAPTGGEYRIPVPDAEVRTDAVTWMQGTVLHLDDRSVDTGVRAESYVLLPHGALLLRRGALWYTDTRSRATRVGTGARDLRVSPDGGHVAFLDGEHGPTDPYGDRFLRVDVLDTATGEQVVASARGTGDRDEGRNEQYDPSIAGIDDGAVYVRGPGDELRAHPFDGSASRRVEEADVPKGRRGGTIEGMRREGGLWRVADGTTEGSVSPSRGYALADTLNARFLPVRLPTGERIAVEPGADADRFELGGWTADDAFWGFAFRASADGSGARGRVVSCSMASATCVAVSPELASRPGAPVVLGAGS